MVKSYIACKKELEQACLDYLQHTQKPVNNFLRKLGGESDPLGPKNHFYNVVLSANWLLKGNYGVEYEDYKDLCMPATALLFFRKLLEYKPTEEDKEDIHVMSKLKLFRQQRSQYEGALKYFAIEELYQSLQKTPQDSQAQINSTDTPEEEAKKMLKNFKTKLREPGMADVLKNNRQSEAEKFFKILSVVASIFGVGLITTLGLMINTLVQTKGRSANFFTSHTKVLNYTFNRIVDEESKKEENKEIEEEKKDIGFQQ
ncbi:hypothetical protein [Legionella septentrionalis]|uniref:Uncharacterized protein n=2 Tax=Legionellaceae TaxID=444 RepID=A0A3S0WZ87_9GAMM|nr:hypothetical protein [Legionella septentrionalis]RUQ81623.1 hypothetical protein EKM59_10145 [Legionella septentrionalis]RUQ95733.1 hypothetical protein ELY11_08625 [Legionella septentrionalis]RUR09154.1 hypothetical protein ELY14_09675 [Legionella septentrionalis]RUR15661.1 hypothetical protein ELY10_05580 [Legionella septentrionalis]